jgi:S1-C subfamily serine protease
MQQRSGAGGWVLLGLALAFGLVGGVAGSYFMFKRLAAQTPPAVATTAAAPAAAPTRLVLTGDEKAIVDAVKKAGPSTVKIAARQGPADPLDALGGGQAQEGIGSGFIITYKGRQVVLTNYHVIQDAQQLVVNLTDGRKIEGRVAGYEATSDIGVVELVNPPTDLRSATLGDSSQLEVGEWVIAIGNPFDYDNAVTVGVVSAKGYRPVSDERSQDVIQTDAAINPGNSGGPLVNLAGDVVGINYRIYSTTGATVGIGFAIPINAAKQTLYYLSEGGPWIGIGDPVPNSMGLAQYLGLSTAEGLIVVEPQPGGPAAKAGVQPRDVILAVDGATIAGRDQFRDKLLAHRIGDTVTLTVQRGQQKLELQMVAGRHPQYKQQ